jgi:hypothetical protein
LPAQPIGGKRTRSAIKNSVTRRQKRMGAPV